MYRIAIDIGGTFTDCVVLGCTIATNAMIQRSGCKTGLITTRGHEDTILIGRVFQKVAGLSERQIIHISQLHKAEPPLVPHELIRGVSERIDCRGEVIAPLNMEEVAAAVEH